MNRQKVLEEAVNKCMKELYSLAQPKISWEDFIEENRKYLEKEKEIEKDENPFYEEYLGPKPYEFYYLPKKILESIVNEYVYAYGIDKKQNLLDIIEILKNYCKEPIIKNNKEYENPDNLEKELKKIIKSAENIPADRKESYEKSYNKLIKDVQSKFFEFLDMAGNFFKWDGELNSFYASIYLGASPSSNKEQVINNWKKYRNIEIKIDEIYDND